MVTASITSRGAGVAASVEGLSHALEQAGHTVRVFALADADASIDQWNGAPATRFAVTGPEPLGFGPLMLPSLLDWQPDIIHLHGLWMYTARIADIAARRSDCPLIVSPHGMLAPSALEFSPFKKRISRWLYQDACFKHASIYHATSDAEASDIAAFGLSQRVDIVPHGIAPRARPSDTAKRKTVVSLGRLHPVKGLDTLIVAWAHLERRFPDWELKIIGPDANGYASELKTMAFEHGLKRCHILGPKYDDAKFRALAQASLFVLPSHTENFGLTVLESLLMETPVIASQGTPWPILRDKGCGEWVELGPESFAAAMAKVMEMPADLLDAMGRRGRDLVVSDFSWAAMARRAVASYLSATEARPAS